MLHQVSPKRLFLALRVTWIPSLKLSAVISNYSPPPAGIVRPDICSQAVQTKPFGDNLHANLTSFIPPH